MDTRVQSVVRPILTSLSRKLCQLSFDVPVQYTINPLLYAMEPHLSYWDIMGLQTGRILLLGMNPGPWGMPQTGVPFGDVSMVQNWFGMNADVSSDIKSHPKRPITGFSCTRAEVSGRRLWGWAAERYRTPQAFFSQFALYNYCPLVFLEDSGRNRTPDKLPAREKDGLFAACDDALRSIHALLKPTMVIGIGRFAEGRARSTFPNANVGYLLHPSPSSRRANSGWIVQAEQQLRTMGIDLPSVHVRKTLR
ncbi:MAG: uracil-DNA glycosylase family protein [Myxococcota bacterium]|nr:uracil-DNA glycosylase family protein [Myxococcota bacterium]